MNGADRKNRTGELKDFFKISRLKKSYLKSCAGKQEFFLKIPRSEKSNRKKLAGE
jgi:hypothetical protein